MAGGQHDREDEDDRANIVADVQHYRRIFCNIKVSDNTG